MENEQYGMPKLGQVQSFLRDVLGDDLLYEIASAKMNNHEIPTIDKDSCRKKWDRYCNEETKDYIDYDVFGTSESIFSLFGMFLEKKEYPIDEIWQNFIGRFALSFYKSLKEYPPEIRFIINENLEPLKKKFLSENELPKPTSNITLKDVVDYQTKRFINNPLLPANWETKEFALRNLIKILLHEIAISSQEKGIDKVKSILSIIFDNFSYKNLFTKLMMELKCKSFEKMYEKMDTDTNINIPYDTSKRKIPPCYKNDENPDWSFLKRILQISSGELKQKFILKFLLKNSIESAKKNFDLTDDDFNFIKEKLNQYCNSNDTPKELINNLVSYSKEKKEKSLMETMSDSLSIFYSSLLCKSEKSENKFLSILNSQIKEKRIAPFFIPYLKALYYLSHRDFSKTKDENLEKAKDCFNEAFEHKYLAGDYLADFLIRGFVLTNYLESNYTAVIKSYNKDSGQINPTSCNSKKFLNFGKAIDLFPDSSEFAHAKVLDSIDLFQKYFPPDFFANKEEAQSYYENELKNKYEIKFEIPNEENKENYIKEHLYNKLKNLKTSDKRNTLIFIKKAISEDNSHNSKQKQLYPPLSLCLKYSLNDERLLDLAKEWLLDTDNPIEVSKVSFEGETPLCELLKIYKYARINFGAGNKLKDNINGLFKTIEESLNFNELLSFDGEKEIAENICEECAKDFQKANNLFLKLEEIINLLIDKIDYESELQSGNRIPTLKYAIDSFNFDFVKKLVDKIPEKKFQNYTIEDSISPLMYAIERKQPVSLGIEEYIRLQKDINIPHKIRKNPYHFTREQSHKEYKASNPRPEGINEYWYHRNQEEKIITEEDKNRFYVNYGCTPQIWKQQVEELDKIIDLFISKTDNVDYHKSYVTTNDHEHLLYTALVFAGQHNDVDTCKKLLKKGAEPLNEEFGFYLMKYGEIIHQVSNNLIYNLIIYNSWETLIMICDDFPEIIKKSVKNNKENINSFTFFASIIANRFIWAGKEKEEYRPIAKYIISRFIELGANPDLETIIGTARKVLSGTKLLDAIDNK